MKCKLCNQTHDSKRENHIITNSLNKKGFLSSYKNLKNHHALKIEQDNISPIYTTPFEVGIFCDKCELSFARIETDAVRYLDIFHNRKNRKDAFKATKIDNVNYTMDKVQNAMVFRAFVLSLLWRVSISKHFDIKIGQKYEDQLKDWLQSNISDDIKNTRRKLSEPDLKIPDITYSIIVPRNKKERGVFYVKDLSDNRFIISTNHLILIFQLGQVTSHKVIKNTLNIKKSDFIYTVLKTNQWAFLRKFQSYPIVKKQILLPKNDDEIKALEIMGF